MPKQNKKQDCKHITKKMAKQMSEEIKDLQHDSKYTVTAGANGEAIVTLIEKNPADLD